MIIDLHCDTFMRMYTDNKSNKEFAKNEYSIDLVKLKKGNVFAQCFAIFNEMGDGYDTQSMYNRIEYMMNGFRKFEEDIHLYKGYDELMNKPKSKVCAIPTIEDLGPILGDISNINKLKNLGFKILSLTWNHENTLGYPNSKNREIMDKGLKKFGIEVVELMNELNMIIDVSHLSDGGFYDVAKISRKPFVATHSNARTVAGHSRNLTDDMIKTLSDSGGVTGINFCPAFLKEGSGESRVEDMITHIMHMKNAGGIECIAIGTDFDGIEGDLEIKDASQHYKLIEGLEAAKFTGEEIDKITFKNALRVLKESE